MEGDRFPHIPDDKASLVADIMFFFGQNAIPNCGKESRHYAEKIASMPMKELAEIALEYAEKYDDEEIRSHVDLGDFVDWSMTHDKRFDPIHTAVNVCEECGKSFTVYYHADGTYEYSEEPCQCENGFHPADGELSISEWLETLF